MTAKTVPASEADLTNDQLVRGVALALRAQWEGTGRFGTAIPEPMIGLSDDESEWADYRDEGRAAILAYLEMLRKRGFRIVRDAG